MSEKTSKFRSVQTGYGSSSSSSTMTLVTMRSAVTFAWYDVCSVPVTGFFFLIMMVWCPRLSDSTVIIGDEWAPFREHLCDCDTFQTLRRKLSFLYETNDSTWRNNLVLHCIMNKCLALQTTNKNETFILRTTMRRHSVSLKFYNTSKILVYRCFKVVETLKSFETIY